MRFNWRFVLGLSISAGFIIYAVIHVDFAQLIHVLGSASYVWTVPMMISVILTMWIRAVRWQKLVEPIQRLPVSTLFSSVMIGFMANNVLPARVGEVIRAISLSQKHKLSKSSIIATVVAERAFDSLGLLTVFLFTLLFVDYPAKLKEVGAFIFVTSILLLFFLYLLKTRTDLAVKLICRPVGFISIVYAAKIESILRKFSVGLTILTDPVLILVVFLQSVFLWAFTGISGYLIFIAFDLYPVVWAAYIVLFVTVLAVTLPSSPGYIGTFHGACVIAFNLINSLGMFNNEVSKSMALSYSILLWSCQFFPVTLIGLLFLKKEHLKLKDMDRTGL